MFVSVNSDFKEYHYFAIVDQFENDNDEKAEQGALDQNELKVMDIMDRIAELHVQTCIRRIRRRPKKV